MNEIELESTGQFIAHGPESRGYCDGYYVPKVGQIMHNSLIER